MRPRPTRPNSSVASRWRPADYARREGFADDGYRVVINCNAHGGQTVFQLHLHLLAGAPLGRFGTPSTHQ
jgi:diadenosine tetraphosphate (Ap4A) HIT family hydrolase